jgi:hypothetical protein
MQLEPLTRTRTEPATDAFQIHGWSCNKAQTTVNMKADSCRNGQRCAQISWKLPHCCDRCCLAAATRRTISLPVRKHCLKLRSCRPCPLSAAVLLLLLLLHARPSLPPGLLADTQPLRSKYCCM